MPREILRLAHCVSLNKWQSQYLNPGNIASQLTLFTTSLCSQDSQSLCYLLADYFDFPGPLISKYLVSPTLPNTG